MNESWGNRSYFSHLQKQEVKENNGITLIVLVITIIVLLILAGVSIAMLTGENGILNQAQEAKKQTEFKSAEEKVKLAIMGARANDGQITVAELKTEIGYQGGSVTGDTFPVEAQMDGYTFTVDANGTVTTPKPLPEGLEIGSTVTYTPSGTYDWEGKYSGGSDTTLNSAEANFKISEWKVLDIENGKVTLVPTAPTTGKVYLGYAQGYNNGVKLLNDACSSLYGNTSKGITARSLNIEDIEKYMTPEALKSAHEYANTAKYGEQVSSAYTTANSQYPVMYAKENLSFINDGPKKENGLGMSEQTNFIEKTENGATDGKITTATSIRPYQTHWYKSNSDMQTAFKTATNGTKYYDFIMPKGSNTYYWLASRCVATYSSNCNFSVRDVYGGSVNADRMYSSGGVADDYGLALFPVVSLNSELISGNKANGFTVQ